MEKSALNRASLMHHSSGHFALPVRTAGVQGLRLLQRQNDRLGRYLLSARTYG